MTDERTFTQQDAEELLRAVRALLSVCDGAHERDDQGFNAPDSMAIRSLLQEPRLEEEHFADLYVRLRKYRGQLSGFGIDYDTLPHPSTAQEGIVVLTIPPPHDSYHQVVFDFGKYGRSQATLAEVAMSKEGRRYLQWIVEQVPPFREPWRTYAQAALDGQPIELPAPSQSASPAAPKPTYEVTKADDAGWLAVTFPREQKDAFKDAIDGRRWVPERKRWEVPDSQVVKVVKFFGGLDKVVLDLHAKALYDVELGRRQALDTIRAKEDTTLDIPGLQLPLRGYQNVGVEFAINAGGRCLIADEMGLGKTVQYIAFVLHRRKENPNYRALVVCPAAVRINWQREIRKFTGEDSCVWTTQGPQGDVSALWHIANFDALLPNEKRYPVLKELIDIGFDSMGVDECHYLKTRDSGRTQAVMGAARKEDIDKYPGIPAKDVIFLTGTPVLNRPAEVFVLLNYLSPNRFPNWFSFANRYGCWPKNNLNGRPSTPQNLDELHDRTKDLVIRRLQLDVQPEMPALTVLDTYVELDKRERRQYDELIKNMFKEWSDQKKPSLQQMQVLGEWLNARKLERAWELIDEYVESGHSVLLFSTRLDPLHETAKKYGNLAAVIDGSMSLERRQKSIDRIQSGDAKVGCLSIRAAGVGINLTAADRVIFLDMDWVPANHLQAQKRAHRSGQERPVIVNYLLVEGTVDEIMKDVLDKKLAIADAIVDGVSTPQKRQAGMFSAFVRRLRYRYKNELSTVSDLEDETQPEEVAA